MYYYKSYPLILFIYCNILFSFESHYIKILFMEYNCTQSSDIKDCKGSTYVNYWVLGVAILQIN